MPVVTLAIFYNLDSTYMAVRDGGSFKFSGSFSSDIWYQIRNFFMQWISDDYFSPIGTTVIYPCGKQTIESTKSSSRPLMQNWTLCWSGLTCGRSTTTRSRALWPPPTRSPSSWPAAPTRSSPAATGWAWPWSTRSSTRSSWSSSSSQSSLSGLVCTWLPGATARTTALTRRTKRIVKRLSLRSDMIGFRFRRL